MIEVRIRYGVWRRNWVRIMRYVVMLMFRLMKRIELIRKVLRMRRMVLERMRMSLLRMRMSLLERMRERRLG